MINSGHAVLVVYKSYKMRLLGIYIDQANTRSFIRKTLKDSWYPFYENISYPPTSENIKLCFKSEVPDLYEIKSTVNSKLKVSMSCIVGKNGSGKSTLLDIMFAIINNFASTHLKRMVRSYGVRLYGAVGVYASLFYEFDGTIYELRCEGTRTDLYRGNQVISGQDDKYKAILHHHFFYTIALNYSLYSFNKKDYQCPDDKRINGNWIDGLFHKNDAYLTPMSLNPFRNNGNIDINKENGLALQRLSALALYFDSKGKNFIPGYKAAKLRYRLRSNYEKSLISKFAAWKEPSNFESLYFAFKDAYASYGLDRVKLGDELFNDVVSYMAYKTLKIGLTYADYKREMTSDRVDMYLEKIADDDSHITYKLRQCKSFAENSIYDRTSGEHEIKLEDIHGNQPISSYEKAFSLLLPPFYDVDVVFEKCDEETKHNFGDDFTFTSMSSGERQLMYSLSSILYHIQNLESVNGDTFRISYKHINLVLDEVELYSHPEYQRTFIADLLDRLSWLDITYPIESVNILLVTHSPFILSDIPKNNILYLKNGKTEKETGAFVNPLGANVNDILHQSFFLENGFMGKHIQDKIESLVDFLKSQQYENKEWNLGKAEKFISLLGDEVVVKQLRVLLARKRRQDKTSYRSWLLDELERLEEDKQ